MCSSVQLAFATSGIVRRRPIRRRCLRSLFTVGKYCNYPLTTTQGDRFASCENIVSRSQTSSLPPTPRPRGRLHCAAWHKTCVA